jgi:hypothetical protein
MTGDLTRLGDDGTDFVGGYPTPDAVRRAYDAADLNRAVQAYRLFFPSVSGLAIFKGNDAIGIVENRVFGTLDTRPRHIGLTLNSDTPYAPLLIDLRGGPMVIELPPGPLICIAMDLGQRWILDMGLPGPDAGAGGRHLLLPPGWEGEVPDGYHAGRASTYRVLGGIRSLPVGGDVPAAVERLKTVIVRPLDPGAAWQAPTWLDLSPEPQDTTPDRWEDNIGYWEALHEVVDSEPPFDGYRSAYGELAALGIAKGQPFAPDARMRAILGRAARTASAQLRVQSFADRRPDRVVWPDRQWEWAALRFENGDFDRADSVDTEARDKWYYQAIGSSPAMFRRDAKAGSLYWLGLRDGDGGYLDGGKAYTLTVPLPVPGTLFWSVTVYDARTRSQVQTAQGKAVLSSLSDLSGIGDDKSITLRFGPTPPADGATRWVQTLPGAGWFVYFRIYGPESGAFDGSWKPGDFEVAE